MNSIVFWMTRSILIILFLLGSLAVILPLGGALKGFLQHHEVLRTVLTVLALVWGLLMLLLANAMAERMVYMRQTFMAALRLSILEARLVAGAVPWIGRWVVPRPDERDGRSNTPIE